MKFSWMINVFSRLDHLNLQVRLIRKSFPECKIFIFSNGPKDPSSLIEDVSGVVVHRSLTNSGHHSGVRDSYNWLSSVDDDSDFIVCSHADVILSDYTSIVEKFFRLIESNDILMLETN